MALPAWLSEAWAAVHQHGGGWLRDYGYVGVFVGTFLEGESILVAAGVAANRGFLHLPYVIAAAFAGSFSGDQLFFFVGRRHGRRLLARYPRWNARAQRVHALTARYHTPFILVFRFLYGLRSISPFALGTSAVSVRRFFVLNMIGALVWSATVASLGYVFGEALEPFGRMLRQHTWQIGVGAVALVGLARGLVLWRRRRRPPPPAVGALLDPEAAPAPPPPPATPVADDGER